MKAAILFIALAFLRQTAPVVIPPSLPMSVSWSSSPTGAGAGQMAYLDDDLVTYSWKSGTSPDYLLLCQGAGNAPNLVLNTPGWLANFALTNSSQEPFMLEFTCADSGKSGWGDNVVITITNP
jgi:hypothetical protein